MFDNVEDIKQKLQYTVILYQSKPIWVVTGGYDPEIPMMLGGPTPPMGINYLDLPLTKDWTSKKSKFVKIDDPSLDFRSVSALSTGYVNYFGKFCTQAVFLSRMPIRSSIQGINSKNTHLYARDDPITGEKFKIMFDALIQETSFCDIFENKYPTITEIKQIFKTFHNVISVAFHRFFAISRRNVGPFFLEYKGTEIGWSKTFDSFELDEKFDHFKEILEYHSIAFKSQQSSSFAA